MAQQGNGKSVEFENFDEMDKQVSPNVNQSHDHTNSRSLTVIHVTFPPAHASSGGWSGLRLYGGKDFALGGSFRLAHSFLKNSHTLSSLSGWQEWTDLHLGFNFEVRTEVLDRTSASLTLVITISFGEMLPWVMTRQFIPSTLFWAFSQFGPWGFCR
jgi:hypothetical protein